MHMLKKRDLYEVPVLFDLSSHPDVYPYIRHKAETSDEFYFLTKQLMEEEDNGRLISRTILDEFEHPIGTINLYDIENKCGFLATWIGQPYFGKGYNKVAKEAFLTELFFNLDIETVLMKVRKVNNRSLHAVSKLPYVQKANELLNEIYTKINNEAEVYDLFVITKDHYSSYLQFTQAQENIEAEVVS